MGPMGIVILVGALYPLLILIWLKHVSRVFFFSRFSVAWMVNGVHNIYNPEVFPSSPLKAMGGWKTNRPFLLGQTVTFQGRSLKLRGGIPKPAVK